MITPATVLALCADVRHRQLGEEMVLLSQTRGEVMVLNPVAAFVVAALDGAASVALIADRVAAEFDVGAEEALADVVEFAARLVELSVAEVRGLAE